MRTMYRDELIHDEQKRPLKPGHKLRFTVNLRDGPRQPKHPSTPRVHCTSRGLARVREPKNRGATGAAQVAYQRAVLLIAANSHNPLQAAAACSSEQNWRRVWRAM